MSGPVDLSDVRVELRGVVILACGYDAPGGMEGQARSLAHALAGLGVPVTYVTTLSSDTQAPLRETRGLVTIFRLPVPRAVDWRTTLELLELFCLTVVRARRARLNLIYAVHHETGAIASRVGQALELPVVVKLACSGVFGDANLTLRNPDGPRILQALRRATRVVAITDDIAQEARRELLIPGERIVRLPNGVDLRRFRPRPGGTVADLRVVFVGRLSAQKRVDVLLEAFARLPQDDVGLLLVGDGPARASLEAQARALGIAGRVQFRGLVSDPLPELRNARVFVLPSIAEGASNALLEALATGVPCVATRLPGTAELVRDGEHALLVPPADVEALSAALARVLGDPDLARRLSEAGRQRAAEFGLESVARRHLDLFHALAAPLDRDPTRPALGPPEGPVLRALGRAGIRGLAGTLRSVAGVLAGRLRPRGR